MDILKKFSEDLEIECMIGQIDNFINYYEKVSQKIDEQQKIIDSIDVLYDMLYEIRQHGIEKVCIFINQSKWSQTVENVQELAAFILQVIKPSPSLHKEMIDLLIRLNNDTNSNNQLNILLPFIINRLMTFYMPKKRQQENKKFTKPPNNHYNDSNKKSVNETINLNNRYVYPFIRLLYKRGLISKEEIIEKVKNYDLSVHFLNVFFLPEIIEVNPNILEDDQPFSISNSNRISESKYLIDFYKKYFLEKIDLYEKMLDNFEPEDDLTKSILHDDVDTLQLIITRNEIDIKKKLVSYNVFDDIKGKMSLLNYASYCGSLKCFKYLFLNQGIIDNNTFYYAICGGNNEIIQIVNKESINIDTTSTNNIQNSLFSAKTFWFPNIGNPIFGNTKANPDNILQYTINKKDQSITVLNCCNINNIIAPTIALHKNDLFDWIFENKFISQGKFGESLEKIALLSAYTGNLHSLIQIIDNGFDFSASSAQKIIFYSARNGFYLITQFLMNIINEKVQKHIPVNEIPNNFIINSIILFGNLSIFKLFINQMETVDLEKAILYSIYFDNKQIVDYCLDNIDKLPITINEDFIGFLFKYTFKKKTDEWFNFLFEKIKKLKPELFTLKLFTSLLNKACSESSLMAVKTITNLILKENPKSDFTDSFIKASSSDAISICRYFIDSKVFINFENLASKANELGSIDIELFKLIINNVNPEIKCLFYKCINQEIKKENLKLIDFLLNENKPTDNELIEAVSTKNIEIVNLVLKYNSKPSFVNQTSSNGTAITIASMNNCADIVKRLLLVPGIDPSKYADKKNSLFVSIIEKYNYEIADSIITFYDDEKIQSKQWLFVDLINEMKYFYLHTINQKNKNIWNIVNRLLDVKSLDVFAFDSPFSTNSTFFCEACKQNEIEIVAKFLKLGKIDVNLCEKLSCSTPLMIAIEENNTEIAKLLINYPKTDINLTNIYQESAITIACKKKSIEIIDLLLNDKRFDQIESKLYIAFIYSNYEISQRLIKLNSFDINKSFCYVVGDYIDHKKEIIETNSLINSIRINDIDKINLIINHPSFNIYKSNINKCLFIAAKNNNIEVFKILIQLIDNDIDIINEKDKNLLVFSAYHLSSNVVDEILNNDKLDPKSEVIFDCFCQLISNSSQIVKLQQFNINQNNHPFEMTNKQVFIPIMKVQQQTLNEDSIPEKGTLVGILNKVLNFDKEHEKTIKFDVSIQNGKSLFTAIKGDFNGINSVINLLIENGCDPNEPDKNGILPLKHAIEIDSFNYVTELVYSHKINFSPFEKGDTYLHVAESNTNSRILSFLLDLNVIDLNAQNDDGETPLIKACKSKRVDNINLLFRKDNLNFLLCDKNGNDALKIADSSHQNADDKVRLSKDSYLQYLLSSFSESTSKLNGMFYNTMTLNDEWNI